MRINVPRFELKDALQGLSRVLPRKSTLPILQAIRFRSIDGRLSATVTDLDQNLTCCFESAMIEGNVESFVLDARHLQPLVKGCDEDLVRFEPESKNRMAVINCIAGRDIRAVVDVLDPKEWPADPVAIITRPVDDKFLPTVRRALPFASDDDSRYVLQSVFLDVSGKSHVIVATDGRRLTTLNTISLPLKESCILPATKFLAWPRLEGATAIGVTKVSDVSWFRLDVGRWTYITRTIDATYPNWRQVVPSEAGNHRIEFGEEDVALLKRVLPTLPGFDSTDGAVRLAGKSGKLSISGKGADDKEWTTIELHASRYEGPASAIGANRDFLLDALGVGFRSFTCGDESGPLVSQDATGGTHVLMPIRLTQAVEVPERSVAKVPVPTIASPEQPAPSTTRNHKEKIMPKKAEPSALDRVLVAYETAKSKVREANDALAAIANAVKEAIREDRQRRSEVDAVRAGLARVQAIRV